MSFVSGSIRRGLLVNAADDTDFDNTAVTASVASHYIDVMEAQGGKASFHVSINGSDLTGDISIEGNNYPESANSQPVALDLPGGGTTIALAGATQDVIIPLDKVAAKMRLVINVTGGTTGNVTASFAYGEN